MSKQRKSAYGGPQESKEVVVTVDRRLLLAVLVLGVFAVAIGIGMYRAGTDGATTAVANVPAATQDPYDQAAVADQLATAGLPAGAVVVTPNATLAPDETNPFSTPAVPVLGEGAEDIPVQPPDGAPTVPLPDSRPASEWEPDVLCNFPDANLTDEYAPAHIEKAEPGEFDGPRLAISDLNDLHTYCFGDVPDDRPATHMFTAMNVGEADLIISKIYTGCGCTATRIGDTLIEPSGDLPEPLVLEPGETEQFEIEFDPRAEQSSETHMSQQKYIQIFTNDPTGTRFNPANPNSHESRFRIVVRPVRGM